MSLTPAQEMLNVKLNCDGFMTDSESEEEEGVSKLSKKSEEYNPYRHSWRTF